MLRTKSRNWEKRSQFSKSFPEARAQQRTLQQLRGANAFFPQPDAVEFLWLKKHVGLRSDKPRKPPNQMPGGLPALRIPLATLKPAGCFFPPRD